MTTSASPPSSGSGSGAGLADATGKNRPHAKSQSGIQNGSANVPPPKTDKPRPHVCATCTRSFARLEHLKRHERSHTKEKPFECPDCSRCFARRDLLLRHQQKLHLTTMPTSRQKARRESASSTNASGSVRVRKSSTSIPTGSASMRPRANTISHVDNATLGMLAAANSSAARHSGMELNLGQAQHPALSSLPGVGGYQFRGMSTAAGHHGGAHGLPRLDTSHFSVDVGASMRTAPPYTSLGGDINMENLWYGQGNTVNPAQLHFSNSPQSMSYDSTASPYSHNFPGMFPMHPGMEDDQAFSWISGFDNQMSFSSANEQAVDGSSPSAMSAGSHDGLNELLLEGNTHPMQTTGMWQTPLMAHTSLGPDYSMDFPAPTINDFYQPGQLSPKSLHAHMGSNERYFASPPPMNPQTPMATLPGMEGHFFQPPVSQAETPSNSAASVSSSNRQSSVTSVSTDSITDATRQALLASLSQPSVFGFHHLKTPSQPSVSSPLSPAFSTRPQIGSNISLPSTYDLQRYIAAYIKYFHPHLPFLHIPSLSFDSPEFTDSIHLSGGQPFHGQPGIAGGAGSLVLAMAAIGAFYEYDNAASKDLFEMAKKMIQLYLEERRKADMSATANGAGTGHESPVQNTPLWLVQAMLLNVIYGHNCGDKTAAGIATTHCAALVSLARAAELARPFMSMSSLHLSGSQPGHAPSNDVKMGSDDLTSEQWAHLSQPASADIYGEWQHWKVVEERKRTLYSIFILSSLLVSAYNHAPALMNSEIRLDLPCDEELWAAETAHAWANLRRSGTGQLETPSFASALSSLLTASHRHPYRPLYQYDQPFGSSMKCEDLPETDLRPSTFGCLVLINALHNYIWETRQRHMGRPWTSQETDAMHAHIEPALRAWQAAWASHPQHSLERPNPFGAGSLSADCIPLLDLAYVRLFVNLGRSKEACFQRDWEAMANELARGQEIIQHAESTLDPTIPETFGHDHAPAENQSADIKMEPEDIRDAPLQEDSQAATQLPPKRERHLRKAAYFAANSMAMSDKLGVTFADFTSRELPLQSAMCAFDCAQVLAEWCAAVQQRVGQYIGILGKDNIDFSQVPAMLLLTGEDIKLFEKINDIVRSAEIKMADSSSMSATQALQSTNNLPSTDEFGYGSKILLITAHMLDRAAVWPVTHEMAQCLQTQAIHMDERAKQSIAAP